LYLFSATSANEMAVPRQQAPRLSRALREEIEAQAAALEKRVDVGESAATKSNQISQAVVSKSSCVIIRLLT
jgi:hypothetical protein